MASDLQSLRIIGVHPVVPTEGQFREALDIMFGEGLTGRPLAEAQAEVRGHFDGLFLVEIAVEPSGAEPEWTAITQPIEGQPSDNWQVPYDEHPIGDEGTRWAFFLHYLDLKRPLRTPVGDHDLPEPTPMPAHLKQIEYESPG